MAVKMIFPVVRRDLHGIREPLARAYRVQQVAVVGGQGDDLRREVFCDAVRQGLGVDVQDFGDTGYLGIIAVFEVLPVTEKISRLILERASSAEIEKEAKSEEMITMKQDGYLKVLEGITTVEEVLRVAQE